MIAVFRRCLSSSSRRLNAVSDLYAKLLTKPHFSALGGDIPKTANEESLYSVVQTIIKSLNQSTLPNEEKAKIHNDIIESMVHKNYGISNLHLNELKKMNERVAPESLIALIRSNPGRVDSSWDLFLRHTDLTNIPKDATIIAMVKKIIQMDDAMVKDGKTGLEIGEIVQIISLLNVLKDKSLVGEEIILPLFNEILSKNLTSLIPIILEFQIPSETLLDKIVESTDKQFLNIIHKIPLNHIISNDLLLFRSLDYLNPTKRIENTEDEGKSQQILLEELEKVKQVPFLKSVTLATEEIDEAKKNDLFYQIISEIQKQKLDENDFDLALKLIRTFGMEIGDIKTALDLYHNYLTKFVSHSERLMFEVFLTLSYQAFKTGTSQLQQYSEAFIPASIDTNDKIYSNILRATILTKSRFDVEDALALYNSKNQQLNKDACESTSMSQFDEVTEALILAFLYNNDVDFARVILEGAMGQKLFSGSTATKAIKSHLALYGEAVEQGTQKEVMENRILNYMKHL
ncbi:hypothetical protein RNJ44_02942 [Nakaseomyces bracarensis]|uniref:Uncharacterized protein n=1 Tax=Nakaseomyces bracarensis TaxID=273131 RepID=A0ABR4P0N3_9SACH